MKQKKTTQKQLRPLGDITMDMEPLLFEMCQGHDLQHGEILGLVKTWLDIHFPSGKEEYFDNTNPVYYYGHKKGLE